MNLLSNEGIYYFVRVERIYRLEGKDFVKQDGPGKSNITPNQRGRRSIQLSFPFRSCIFIALPVREITQLVAHALQYQLDTSVSLENITRHSLRPSHIPADPVGSTEYDSAVNFNSFFRRRVSGSKYTCKPMSS
jgi:hypothetical protein